ncbi:MAG: excisionase family DNA-binding protein [Mangrovibacterium sp.]
METLFIKRTTKEDQKIAQSSIPKIRETSKRIRKNRKNSVKIKIHEHGEFLTVPHKAISILLDILNHMAEGKSVTLLLSDAEIGTQDAADMLNMSRPHLVKLLENGEIPFTKVGSHRRIRLEDVIEYDKKLRENRGETQDF